jgi:UDP-glucose 4-epimerase
MRLLITGGSGYLGHLLAQRCATMPSVGELRILDITEPTEPVAGATYLDGDVTSPADVKSAMSGVDAVVHLAGPTDPELMLRYPASGLNLSVNGTNTVLDAARAHGETHVILASSAAVYGANPAVPAHEGLTPMPHDPFAVAKLAAENLAVAYRQSYRLPVLALRLFAVYGIGQRPGHPFDGSVSQFVEDAVHNRPVVISGDGRGSVDLMFAGDLVEVIAQAIEGRVTHPSPVNLGTGTLVTELELVAKLAEILEQPVALRQQSGQPRIGLHRYADTSRQHMLFGRHDFTPIEEGLAAVVAAAQRAATPASLVLG